MHKVTCCCGLVVSVFLGVRHRPFFKQSFGKKNCLDFIHICIPFPIFLRRCFSKIQKLRTDLAHGDLSSRIGGSGICGSKTGAILRTLFTLSAFFSFFANFDFSSLPYLEFLYEKNQLKSFLSSWLWEIKEFGIFDHILLLKRR